MEPKDGGVNAHVQKGLLKAFEVRVYEMEPLQVVDV
jgi:hypothetical protein